MKKSVAIHPFLFALYPIIYLVAHNIGELLLIDRFSLTSVFLPMIVSLGFASVSMLMLGLILKNAKKAALIVTASLFLFFSYGHFYDMTSRLMRDSAFWIGRFVIGPHKIVFFAWCALFCIAAFFSIKTRRDLKMITSFLNITAGCLIAISMVNIGFHEFKRMEIWKGYADKRDVLEERAAIGSGIGYSPDIYYIILDGYTSSKKLEEIYGFDNSEFTDYLVEKGFFIAFESMSNYAQTTHSLASSLNMEYINYVTDIVNSKYSAMGMLYLKLRNNKVIDFLKKRGYKFVHFATSYGLTEHNKFADIEFHFGKKNEFYYMLVNTTMLCYFREKFNMAGDKRRMVLDTFSTLSKMPAIEGPKFVFAHMIIPHPPYYFDEDGGMPPKILGAEGGKNAWAEKEAYVKQLIFLNKKIKAFLDKIESGSSTPPVIILQGDHGTEATFSHGQRSRASTTDEMMEERMSIFNAYCLPQGGKKALYSSISPVNTFRVLFNYYFNADFELLEERSYFSSYERPFEFIAVNRE